MEGSHDKITQLKTTKPVLGVGSYHLHTSRPPAKGCGRSGPPRQPGVVGGKATAASTTTVITSPGPLGTEVTSISMEKSEEPHSCLIIVG